MIKTIDMKLMRYINLFSKTSRVSPNHCFVYNENIIFVVPSHKLSMAIGDKGKNIKKMSKHIGLLTSGGDCPGLNAAIRGVGKAGIDTFGMQFLGFRDGFRVVVAGPVNAGKSSLFNRLVGEERAIVTPIEVVFESLDSRWLALLYLFRPSSLLEDPQLSCLFAGRL